jgi:hypothetical protein
MRFESVTIAAGEEARCKSRPRIAPDRARLNGNTFTAGNLPSAVARRCFEAHAEALQPCREGPAQVMQPLAALGPPGPPTPRLRNQGTTRMRVGVSTAALRARGSLEGSFSPTETTFGLC